MPGFSEACLVIGPEHQVIRDYYTVQSPPKRIRIEFAVQQQPLGTADAVFAAKEFAGNDLFLVINSDNYYPVAALRAMRELGGAGVALFERDRLVAESNIPEDRVLKFALAKIGKEGCLERILEKPSAEVMRALGLPVYVSMNCWVFSPVIFRACQAIQPSARGELELTRCRPMRNRCAGRALLRADIPGRGAGHVQPPGYCSCSRKTSWYKS